MDSLFTDRKSLPKSLPFHEPVVLSILRRISLVLLVGGFLILVVKLEGFQAVWILVKRQHFSLQIVTVIGIAFHVIVVNLSLHECLLRFSSYPVAIFLILLREISIGEFMEQELLSLLLVLLFEAIRSSVKENLFASQNEVALTYILFFVVLIQMLNHVWWWAENGGNCEKFERSRLL